MRNARDICFATFNLLNLQLPSKSYRGKKYTRDQYDAKIEWTAEMLRRLSADIIAFQELWSRECLDQAFAAANLNDDYELKFIKERWYDIAVAAAVRKPWKVTDTKLHKKFPDEFVLRKRGRRPNEDPYVIDPEDDEIAVMINHFSRTVLQLTVEHSERTDVPKIDVFCCHLKAKRETRLDSQETSRDEVRQHATDLGSAISTIRRTAEAAALRVVLNNKMSDTDTPVVVLGDLNDGQLSNTLSITTGQPSIRFYADSDAGERSDQGLYAASLLQDVRSLRDVYYTYEYAGLRETIDHVLVSEQFYDHSEIRKWSFREMEVWNDHLNEADNVFSDHGVVRVRFDWRPGEA